MNIYFCEKCGKRVTGADLDQGLGKDKGFTGVFCGECSDGVLTVELLPIDPNQAKEILRAAASCDNKSRSATRPPPSLASSKPLPRNNSGRTGSASIRSRSHPSSRVDVVQWFAASARPWSKRRWVMVGALGGVLAAISILLLSRKPSDPVIVAKGVQRGARTSAFVQVNADDSGRERGDLRSPPSEKVRDAGPSSCDELAAEGALAVLLRDPGKDSLECASRLEAFLAKHGNARVAARARKMLVDWGATARSEPSNAVQSEIVNRELVCSIDFENALDQEAVDLSGNGHRLIRGGVDSWGEGPNSSKAIALKGGGSRIISGPALKLLSEQLTLEFWVYNEGGAQWRYIVYCPGAFHFIAVEDGFEFTVYIGGTKYYVLTEYSHLSRDKWTHVVACYKPGDQRVYINGIKVTQYKATNEGRDRFSSPSSDVWIGNNREGTRAFRGKLAALRIHNSFRPPE